MTDCHLARSAHAEREAWGGEAEGLKVSLAAANAKLAQLDNLITHRTAAVHLGMPAFPDIAGHHVTAEARLPAGSNELGQSRDGPQ